MNNSHPQLGCEIVVVCFCLSCTAVLGGESNQTPRHVIPSHIKTPQTEVPDSVLAWDAPIKEYIAKPRETEALFIFNLTNLSPSQITIQSVTTSCGCTVAKLPAVPWVMAPGTNGQIQATMKLVGRSGIVMKSLTVNTDRGQRTLMVRANIPIPSESQPR